MISRNLSPVFIALMILFVRDCILLVKIYLSAILATILSTVCLDVSMYMRLVFPVLRLSLRVYLPFENEIRPRLVLQAYRMTCLVLTIRRIMRWDLSNPFFEFRLFHPLVVLRYVGCRPRAFIRWMICGAVNDMALLSYMCTMVQRSSALPGTRHSPTHSHNLFSHRRIVCV